MSNDEVHDDDNPPWTREDFLRAKSPRSLPPHILEAFPNTAARLMEEDRLTAEAELLNYSVRDALRKQSVGARYDRLAA